MSDSDGESGEYTTELTEFDQPMPKSTPDSPARIHTASAAKKIMSSRLLSDEENPHPPTINTDLGPSTVTSLTVPPSPRTQGRVSISRRRSITKRPLSGDSLENGIQDPHGSAKRAASSVFSATGVGSYWPRIRDSVMGAYHATTAAFRSRFSVRTYLYINHVLMSLMALLFLLYLSFMHSMTIQGKVLALVCQGFGGLLASAGAATIQHTATLYALHDISVRLFFKSVPLSHLAKIQSHSFSHAPIELKIVRYLAWIIPLATLVHEVGTEIVPEDMPVDDGICTHFLYSGYQSTAGWEITALNFLERYEGFRDKVLFVADPLVLAPVTSTLIDADHSLANVKSTDKQDAFYVDTVCKMLNSSTTSSSSFSDINPSTPFQFTVYDSSANDPGSGWPGLQYRVDTSGPGWASKCIATVGVVRVQTLVRYSISGTGGAVKMAVETLQMVGSDGSLLPAENEFIANTALTKRNQTALLMAAREHITLISNLTYPWWLANHAGLTLSPDSADEAGLRVSMMLGSHLERLGAVNANVNIPCQMFTDTILLHLRPIPILQGVLTGVFVACWFILTIHLLASGSALRRTALRWQWRVFAIVGDPLRLDTDISQLLVSETQHMGQICEAYRVEPHLSHLMVRFGEDRRTRGERVGHLRVGMVHDICKPSVERQYRGMG
ncbi:hypothetical protein HDV00_002196 [Rhizophlyctis rosea]|nr:hypothetical protein HDV00_002196 [Rhizophlyctis rosea]